MTRTPDRTRPPAAERSQIQYAQQPEPADAGVTTDEDELAAWGEGSAAPVLTPMVASPALDGELAEASVRGTGGATVLDETQQATVVRRLLLGELTTDEASAAYRVSGEQLTQWMRKHRRTVRRSIEEQIGSALSAQGLEKEDFVLSGNLESMSLSDLLETVQLGRKNAHIRVESGTEVGEVWCSDGDVIDARVGNLVGTPAVYRLLELTEGKLQAEFSSIERERTILASTETLLIECARRADERKMLRDRIGDLQRVYMPGVGAALAAALEPRRRDLLQAFDGSRSVESVLGQSDRPELETLTLIADLLAHQQLVPLTTPRVSEKAAAPPVMKSAAQTGYASLFPSNGGPPTLPSASTEEASPAPPLSQALSARGGATISVPPIVPSVALLQALPDFARRAAPFVLGSGALVFAFAVGLWSARSPAPARLQAEPAPSSSASNLSEALCGPGMVLFTAEGGAGAEQRPFCLAQRSVRTAEYQACVDSKHCEPTQSDAVPAPGEAATGKAQCNAGQPGSDPLPINCVTQRQAEQYCEWRGQRLPLPAEWELAWQASRGPQPRTNLSFEVAGLDSPLGELSEWTRERSPRPRRVPQAAAAQPSPEVPAQAAPSASAEESGSPTPQAAAQPEAQAQPAPAQAAEAPATGAGTTPDRVDVIANGPDAPAFAVLRAPPPSVASAEARPKRLYTNATAQGRSIGFRCAVSLETSH